MEGRDDQIAQPLARDELDAEDPCRACGQPWVDGQSWASQGTRRRATTSEDRPNIC
ncbi:hypothetical protein [Allosaccharopolyspora coralli]|nr:hypothetical protein [Allosaccharopolyspora coralli]